MLNKAQFILRSGNNLRDSSLYQSRHESEWSNEQTSQASDREKSWLFDAGSLTQKIRALCVSRAGFHVKVLSQRYILPLASEQQLLNQCNQVSLLREVLLCDGDEPLIYARTILPVSGISEEATELFHLGTKPLGEILFNNSNVQRHQVQASLLNSEDYLLQQVEYNTQLTFQHLWARRAVFSLHDYGLLVNEIFLPNVFTRIQEN